MALKQIGSVEKYLHPNAARLAREQVNEFAFALLLLAKSFAHRRGDDEVMSTHVQEAVKSLRSHRQHRLRKDFLIALGGALFGAFITGFISELSAGQNRLVIAGYVALGIIGLPLIFINLQE